MPSLRTIVIAVFASIALCRVLRAVLAAIMWSRRSVVTVGTVIAKTNRSPRWNDFANFSQPHLDVEFADTAGHPHLLKSSIADAIGMWGHWKIGCRLPVAYDPDNPDNCELTLSALPLRRKLLDAFFMALNLFVIFIVVKVMAP